MILALLQPARAADPAFVGTDVSGQTFAKPTSHVAAQLGGAFTSGNTRTYVLNAAIEADYGWARNKLGVSTGANLGRAVLDTNADGHLDAAEQKGGWAETAKKLWIDLRYDRYVGKASSLYVLTGTLTDPFAGYDNRTHLQAGYSRVLLQTPTSRVLAEFGADAAYEDFVDGVEPTHGQVYAARAMGGIQHAFNANVSFLDTLELYENLQDPLDLRVLNQASLSARLTDKLSLTLAHALAFDNVPVEGFQRLDQTTTVTFVAAFR